MKSKVGIVFFIVIVCVAGLYLYANLKKQELYKYVDSQDYQIKYICVPSLAEYRKLEIVIYPDGRFIANKYMASDEVEKTEGHYDKETVKNFVKFAIKKDITKMTDDMDAEDICDGSSTFYELKLGSKTFRAGGYMAGLVNRNFGKINDKFNELEHTVINNQ